MPLTRRQFLALGGTAGGAAIAAGGLGRWAWPLFADEDLLPGRGPDLALAKEQWPTGSDRARFAVLGDNGSGGRQALAVARRMAATYEKSPFGVVLLLGDISYYGSITSRWDDVFLRPFEPLLDAGVRFELAIGNHDVSLAREDAAAEEIEAQLRMVGTPDEHYVARHGPVDVFVLDSSTPSVLGARASAQIDWLDGELRASDALWRVVALHHPLYSSGQAWLNPGCP